MEHCSIKDQNSGSVEIFKTKIQKLEPKECIC